MFDFLSEKLDSALKKIRGKAVLSPGDVDLALKEVRMALLEADVNFKVAKDFCARVAEKAVGESVLKSLSPGQQVIKIVHEELTNTMGGEAAELELRVAPPAIIMLVGLQGSGKTTTASKLAKLLKEQHKRRPLLVPADVYRPAAIEQLKTLGKAIDCEVFDTQTTDKPLDIVVRAKDRAVKGGFDVMIIDTAGRLQIDETLMQELKEISSFVQPHNTLLVVDAMTGQEAVNVALGFDGALTLTGLILTKMDGDARGGAALSIRAVTGKPVMFVGMSEKPDGLEVFHPERVSSRILGMGDVLSLIEKATNEVSIEDSIKLQKKIKKQTFSLEDFLDQMRMIRRMGSLASLTSMIPGINKIAKQIDPEAQEKEFKRIEAIILSMTLEERKNHEIINGSRRKRIAKGSGTSVEDLNKLIKNFNDMKKMMKELSKMGPMGLGGLLGGKGLGGLMRR